MLRPALIVSYDKPFTIYGTMKNLMKFVFRFLSYTFKNLLSTFFLGYYKSEATDVNGEYSDISGVNKEYVSEMNKQIKFIGLGNLTLGRIIGIGFSFYYLFFHIWGWSY